MATIISQLNLTMMGRCKRHDKVLAFPFCTSTRQVVTCINFPSSFEFINHNSFDSWRLSTAYQCTSSSLQETYINKNNDDDLFAAEKFTMMKPSVGKSTNPATSSSCKFVDTLSRILASLLRYGVVFTTFVTMAACLYASNSALAASYGSSSSSWSSSHGSASAAASYYLYQSLYRSNNNRVDYSDQDDDSSITHTCTCDTSCTDCIIDCDIRKNGYKVEEEKEEEEEEEEVNNSSTNSCSCNCHRTCYFHQPVDHFTGYIALACIGLFVIAAVTEKPSAGN